MNAHPFIVAVLASRVNAAQLPPLLSEKATVFRQVVSLGGRNTAQVRNFLLRLHAEHYAHNYLVLLDYSSNNSNDDVARLLAHAASWRLSVVLYGSELCHAAGLPAELAAIGISAFYDERVLRVDPARVNIARGTFNSSDEDQNQKLAARAVIVLELASDADTHSHDTVKRAYRRLALKYHPDKHMSASAEERQRLTESFHVLDTTYHDLCSARRWTNQ